MSELLVTAYTRVPTRSLPCGWGQGWFATTGVRVKVRLYPLP